MANNSPGYAITLRVELSPESSSTASLAQAVIDTGAALTALDVVESSHERMVVDVTRDQRDQDRKYRK